MFKKDITVNLDSSEFSGLNLAKKHKNFTDSRIKSSLRVMANKLKPVNVNRNVGGIQFFNINNDLAQPIDEVVLSKRCMFALEGNFEIKVQFKTTVFGFGSLVSTMDPAKGRTFGNKLNNCNLYSIINLDNFDEVIFEVNGKFIFVVEDHMFDKDVSIFPLQKLSYDEFIQSFSYQCLTYSDVAEISEYLKVPQPNNDVPNKKQVKKKNKPLKK